MTVDPKVLFVRAAKTFVQGFIGYLTLALAGTNLPGTTAAWRGLVVGAVAAGVSAIMNLIIKPQEAK